MTPEEIINGPVCVDNDCPWPEHTGECPTPTLELWRAEAWRCRAMVGKLIRRVNYLERMLRDPRCQRCGHPAHLSPCTRRMGTTAYACDCHFVTLPKTSDGETVDEKKARLEADLEQLFAELRRTWQGRSFLWVCRQLKRFA